MFLKEKLLFTFLSNSSTDCDQIPPDFEILSKTTYQEETEFPPMLTISEIVEHLFCQRFTYFIHCLNIPQHEELRQKVQMGRALHEKREKQNIDYLRKKLGCIDKEISVYLASKELRLKGIIDEVLYLSDLSLAPLDYKFTKYNEFIFKTHRVQSTIFAMLIKEIYKKEVHSGYICYTRDGNKVVRIDYSDNDFRFIRELTDEILYIIQTGYFPKKSSGQLKCLDCCYKNICVKF